MVVASSTLVALLAPAQTLGQPERFTAVAMQNNEYGAAQGTVEITVNRWSTASERQRLVTMLQEKGPGALLKAMQAIKPSAEFERQTPSATICAMCR